MLNIPGIPQNVIDLLVAAGIKSPEDVLEAGQEGLVAIDGIGSTYAERLLEAANTGYVVILEEQPESEPELEPAEEEPAEEVEEEPAEEVEAEPEPELAEEEPAEIPPRRVTVRATRAVLVGHLVLHEGHRRTVPYGDYVHANELHPGSLEIV